MTLLNLKKKPGFFSVLSSTVMILLYIIIISSCKNNADSLALQQHKEWKDYGGGPDHSKFVDLKQITKSNVDQLQIQFVVPTYDKSGYNFNPIIVDNVMYVLGRNNSLIAVVATTGKEIWIHKDLRGIIARGINFWQS